MTMYIPLLVVVLSLAGALVGYTIQRRNEAHSALREVKRKAYHDFATLMGTLSLPEGPDPKHLIEVKTKLLLIAADDVIRAYQRAAEGIRQGTGNVKFQEMLLAMRRDCLQEKTNLSGSDILGIVY